jgi:opacity protein-like surface antigen
MARPAFALWHALPVVSALCIAAPQARAQAAPAATIYRPGYLFAAGIDIPTGTTGDLHSTGWKIQGGVDWMNAASPFGLRADLSFASMSAKRVVGTTVVGPDDLHLFSITGDGVWMRRPTAGSASLTTPYLLAGIGLYHGSVRPGSLVDNGSTTNFGFNLGGGVMYRLAGFETFAELRWHNVFSGVRNGDGSKGSAHYIPIIVGVRFGGT